jgi:RNA polymerase sigma-70 factor (ECF subfamily)
MRYYLSVAASSVNRAAPKLRALPGSGDGAPSLTDEQLVAAVQDGDDRVASLMYDRLADVVDKTLYRVFGRREADHDDLIQMAFEQIVITLSRRSFAGACSLRTWASSVTANVALTALRRRSRERKVVAREVTTSDDDFQVPSGVDLEMTLDARGRLQRLREHLVAMKLPYAETVFLHDALGHELAEIAVMTGVSVSAAQSRLVRGRKELRKRLERDQRLDARRLG